MSAPTLVAPHVMFTATVMRITELSRNFRRFTFGGPGLANFDNGGWDQRIKLVFPLPGTGLDTMPTGSDWYYRWRELPDGLRNPLRTYTVRAARPERGEVDVDIALHGRTGPASRWALDAEIGDTLMICGPNAEHGGPYGGVDFLPPAHTAALLLAGDPTALPAIAAILETLPSDTHGIAVLEVEHASDARAVGTRPPGVEVQVLVRQPGHHGSQLIPAVEAAAARLCGGHPVPPESRDLEDVDVDVDMLWEVPRDGLDRPARDETTLYAWLAGEASVIKTLRRHLVGERGVDRKSVAFMGYWRCGRAEDNR